MTPQEAVSAFFNIMRSETDQAGLMYSQFAVVQALDYVIDRWEDLNPLARDKAGNRTREWLEHLETVFGGMSTEELCAHKFDFSAELRDIADRGFTEDRVIPDYRGDNFQRVAQARAILADGIYGSVDGIVAHIRDQGCPYALHATSLEIVRRLARIDVERFGEDNCPGQLKILETIESLRG